MWTTQFTFVAWHQQIIKKILGWGCKFFVKLKLCNLFCWWPFLSPHLFGVCLYNMCFIVILLNNISHVFFMTRIIIILHIVIWCINDNFTQSLLLSFVTSNKLELIVYLLENMSQTIFTVDKQICVISKGLFSIGT